MEPTLGPGVYARAQYVIAAATGRNLSSPPGQPLHTYYLPAQHITPATSGRIGNAARKALARYAGGSVGLSEALHLRPDEVEGVYSRLEDRLRQQPIADLRIDFEDGYGRHPDEEEDATAEQVGSILGADAGDGELPTMIGIRVKALAPDLAGRALRTIDLVVTSLVEAAGELPPGFVVTLPKVESPAQPAALADFLSELESQLNLESGAIGTEIMVESPGGLIGDDGRIAVRNLTAAGTSRLRAVHFGVYDYTTSIGIAANRQTLVHESADFARHVMQVELAGTGLWMSDGGTNVIPQGPHPEDTADESERDANRRAVHLGWWTHYRHVMHSLGHGIYQGWDVHPAQLVTRYAANYLFYQSGLEDVTRRLRRYLDAADDGGVVDEPATATALLAFVHRALACGAADPDAVATAVGVAPGALESRSLDGLA